MSNNEILNQIRNFKELQIFIKQLEDEAEAIKTAITAEMEAQQKKEMIVEVFKVKYTTYKSNRVDTTALKRELPDIAARFMKTSEARRFTVS